MPGFLPEQRHKDTNLLAYRKRKAYKVPNKQAKTSKNEQALPKYNYGIIGSFGEVLLPVFSNTHHYNTLTLHMVKRKNSL